MSISKILSLLVAGVYLLVPLTAYLGGDQEALEGFFKTVLFLLLPLACIWFGDEMGDWMGTIRLHAVTSLSPGSLVKFMGWVILFLPVIMLIVATITDRCYFKGG
jgi:hypothetical protein